MEIEPIVYSLNSLAMPDKKSDDQSSEDKEPPRSQAERMAAFEANLSQTRFDEKLPNMDVLRDFENLLNPLLHVFDDDGHTQLLSKALVTGAIKRRPFSQFRQSELSPDQAVTVQQFSTPSGESRDAILLRCLFANDRDRMQATISSASTLLVNLRHLQHIGQLVCCETISKTTTVETMLNVLLEHLVKQLATPYCSSTVRRVSVRTRLGGVEYNGTASVAVVSDEPHSTLLPHHTERRIVNCCLARSMLDAAVDLTARKDQLLIQLLAIRQMRLYFDETEQEKKQEKKAETLLYDDDTNNNDSNTLTVGYLADLCSLYVVVHTGNAKFAISDGGQCKDDPSAFIGDLLFCFCDTAELQDWLDHHCTQTLLNSEYLPVNNDNASNEAVQNNDIIINNLDNVTDHNDINGDVNVIINDINCNNAQNNVNDNTSQ
jgi:hypothetical protein